jgi:hypothetical protein
MYGSLAWGGWQPRGYLAAGLGYPYQGGWGYPSWGYGGYGGYYGGYPGWGYGRYPYL